MGPPDEERRLPTACSDEGGTVHGAVSDGVWAAADGPHWVMQDVNADVLVIEAGALVCAAPGARIIVNRLTAEGAADSIILFTAQDTTNPWGGILARGTGLTTLAHVVLEHARQGVIAEGGNLSIRATTVRQIQGAGIRFGSTGPGEMIGAVVDSACLTLCAASDAAVSAGHLSLTQFLFEDSHILNSGAGGLLIGGNTAVRLLGGSIEGSAGTGLHLQGQDNRRVTVAEARPVRITGGGSYPAEMTLGHAAVVMRAADAQAALLGNARDTLVVQAHGSFDADSVIIRPGLPWIVRGTVSLGVVTAMHLEPGASMTVFDRLPVVRLYSSGSAAAPVTIIGRQTGGNVRGWIQIWGQETSRLSHTRLSGVWIERVDAGPLTVEDVTADSSRIRISGAGSRVTRTRMSGARADFNGALVISARDVTVTHCEVTGSPGDGVRVEVADGVTVHDCNIHDNMDVGLRNLAANVVDARNNWWGSAAGPLGAGGDGVAGNVLFEPYRTEPAPLGAAASTLLPPGQPQRR